MRVLLVPALLLGVAACSSSGVPGANVDLTPPAFAERPPPSAPPDMASAAPASAPRAQPGEPVPLTPTPAAAPSAELSIPGPPGPPLAATTAAQLPPPPPEVASPPPTPPAIAAAAPPPAPPPPPPPEAAAVPPPASPPPMETAAVPPPAAPPPEVAAAAAAPPPEAAAPAVVFPFWWPGQWPGPRLTLSNYSYDRAHVEATVTAGPDCGAGAVSRTEFDLTYNGTRVIQPPDGDDVCWRRDMSTDGAAGPQWSGWNRAFLSAGRSVDSRL